MATPSNAPYKKRQRAAEKAYRNRGEVIWVSCVTEGAEVQGMMIKRNVQGTKRINRGLRGKAALKQAKRLRHSRRFYLMQKIDIRVEKMLVWLDSGATETVYRD